MGVLKIILMISIILSCKLSFSKNVVISTGEYEPLAGKKIHQNGFVLDLVRKAFSKVGYKVKYVFYPWPRAYQALLDHKVDASAFWYKSESREKHCIFSEKVFSEKIYFYYNKRKNVKEWNKLEDFNSYKIGATRGFTYTDKFWSMRRLEILNIETSDTDISNFKKILNGRIDIFLCTKFRANFILNKYFSPDENKKISHLKKPLRVSDGHLIFLKNSDKSKELVADFNIGLKQIQNSKEYEEMYKNLLKAFD